MKPNAYYIKWPTGNVTVSPVKPPSSNGMVYAPMYTNKPSIIDIDRVRDRVSIALFGFCYNEGSNEDRSSVDVAIIAVEESF